MLFHEKAEVRPEILKTVIWLIVGCLVIWFYLHDYRETFNSYRMRRMLLEGNLIFWGQFAKYLFCYLGAPLTTGSVNVAFGVGIAGTVFFIITVATYRREAMNSELSPFVVLGVFAILSAVLAGIGRGRLGPVQALESRYITLSSFLWIGNLVFLRRLAVGAEARRMLRTTPRRVLSMTLILAILALVCIHTAAGSRSATQRQSLLVPARNELLTLKDEALLGRLFPRVPVLKQRAAILREHHLSVYR